MLLGKEKDTAKEGKEDTAKEEKEDMVKEAALEVDMEVVSDTAKEKEKTDRREKEKTDRKEKERKEEEKQEGSQASVTTADKQDTRPGCAHPWAASTRAVVTRAGLGGTRPSSARTKPQSQE